MFSSLITWHSTYPIVFSIFDASHAEITQFTFKQDFLICWTTCQCSLFHPCCMCNQTSENDPECSSASSMNPVERALQLSLSVSAAASCGPRQVTSTEARVKKQSLVLHPPTSIHFYISSKKLVSEARCKPTSLSTYMAH